MGLRHAVRTHGPHRNDQLTLDPHPHPTGKVYSISVVSAHCSSGLGARYLGPGARDSGLGARGVMLRLRGGVKIPKLDSKAIIKCEGIPPNIYGFRESHASAPSTALQLSTLLRTTCNGGHACYMHQTSRVRLPTPDSRVLSPESRAPSPEPRVPGPFTFGPQP